ncbi:MAG: biopolymer transporter Tol, partial [Ignavibacteriae bacterium]|nr:biopolymer transporter Tol [Ignavibacteriota bacterium]
TINMPAWFAEGTAQYMRDELNYDNWDSHRDMILRSYALDNNMLTWNEMGVFGKTSLGNESVYNSGFALTKYIAQKYGEDKIREITYKLGKLTNFTIDAAFDDVLGKDGNEIYNEWSNYLKEDYAKRTISIKKNLVEGEKLNVKGVGNFYPIYTKDEKSIFYLSNAGGDYLSLTSIYKYDKEKKETELVEAGVRSTFSFIPGTNKIVFAKLSEKNPKWTNIHDLYVYDIDEEEDKRLTFGLRANNPAVSNDGKKIVFVFQQDGTSNLALVDVDGKNFKRLTFYEQGEQVFNPKFSSNDKSIIFDYAYHNGRDIATINADGTEKRFLIKTDLDERNASCDKNGNIIYSSDKTGIFNIYSFNPTTKKTKQLTNVLGGAFMPSLNNSGDIIYAGYTSKGYKIFEITSEETEKVVDDKNYIKLENPPLNQEKRNGDFLAENIERLKNFNDYELPNTERKKYSSAFTRLTVLPFVRYDNYGTSDKTIDKIKPGLYVSSTDMLNRYALFAGGSINTRFERDLFLTFMYRNKIPLLYQLGIKPELQLDVFSISRKADVDIQFGVDNTTTPPTYEDQVNTGVTYNLFEVDVALKHRIFSSKSNLEFRFIFSQYSATIGSFVFPNSRVLYPSSSDNYFTGRNLQLKYSFTALAPTVDRDINPVGMEIEAKYNYEMNKYNPDSEYEVKDGVLLPVFKDFNFHKVELNLRKYFSLFNNHTLSARFRVASVLGPQVPDFFDFYLGGLVGMKSYPFYSISGNELGWLNLTYRLPVFKNIDTRIGHLYLDKLFFSVHGDFGNAWNGEIPKLNEFKKGFGAELRLKMISFYLFPTSLFFNASYSFDRFDKTVRDEVVTYGKEWQFYGGILFDFSF